MQLVQASSQVAGVAHLAPEHLLALTATGAEASTKYQYCYERPASGSVVHLQPLRPRQVAMILRQDQWFTGS